MRPLHPTRTVQPATSDVPLPFDPCGRDAAATIDRQAVASNQVLTVDELAEVFRVDRKTIYALIRRGEIPGVRRIGRAVRVHLNTALHWLETGAG